MLPCQCMYNACKQDRSFHKICKGAQATSNARADCMKISHGGNDDRYRLFAALVQLSFLVTGMQQVMSVQAVIMIEVLPITPDPICALCWLPGTMVQAKKLAMKSLVASEQLKHVNKQSS